jgi:amino acid adenylation domain-containing protein
MSENIAAIIQGYATSTPSALAASADGENLTYAEFCDLASRLAGELERRGIQRLAILGSRSLGAFIGVLASYWAGTTYVPLSLKAPRARLIDMLHQTDCEVVLLDKQGADLYDEDLAAAGPDLVIIGDLTRKAKPAGHVRELSHLSELPDVSMEPVSVPEDHPAYIIFTSGTTGSPKGVVVSVSGVRSLLAVLRRRYDIGPADRVAETTDLSFDVSLGNMLLAWSSGASLHAIKHIELVTPTQVIQSKAITVWFSVPAIIALAQRAGALTAGAVPLLRYSMFAGEPLSLVAAEAWQQAAPNSRVENLYGPTEATVVCIGQSLPSTTTSGPSSSTSQNGMMPIGMPFEGMDAVILDSELGVAPPGTPGQLALSGKQLALGYLNHPDFTAERFPFIDGRRWYLTGDAAYQDEDGRFHHLGRLDNQIKVRGYRVELEEVEHHLRVCCKATIAAVVGWPRVSGSIEGLVGFVVADPKVTAPDRNALRERIPSYMVPSAVHTIETMPMTDNGKIDRAALIKMLEAKSVK